MSSPSRKRKSLDFRSGPPRRFVVFSLKDFDINQGQKFEEWEKEKILSNLLVRFRQISCYTIEEALGVTGNFACSIFRN